MGDERISPIYAAEIEACFKAHAAGLFGYACALTRGDRAFSEDLVQEGFAAVALAWGIVRCLAEEQRRAWLQKTITYKAVSSFRRETAWRDRLPLIEALYQRAPVDVPDLAYTSIKLKRCLQIIKDMPEQEHAVAVLRWLLGMKLSEIAAALGISEKTVSVHLTHARRLLRAQLGPEHLGDDGWEGRES